METLDNVAGVIEVVLVMISLGLLLAACGFGRLLTGHPAWTGPVFVVALLAPFAGSSGVGFAEAFTFALGLLGIALTARLAAGRRVAAAAVLLAAVTALTVAQPFGMRVTEVGRTPSSPAVKPPTAEERRRAGDPAATHRIELAGVRAFDFVLHRRDIFSPLAGLGECCPAKQSLRARSWLRPGLLTHGSDVARMCGATSDTPCWSGRRRPPDPALQLWQRSGDWYVSLAVRSEEPGPPLVWRLGMGVVSTPGLAFWLVASGLVALMLGRQRFPRA